MHGWVDIAWLIGGWAVTGVACAGLLWWLLGTPRWRTRRAMTRCIACSYDLTGVAAGVCPECGRAVSAARWRRGGRRWRTAILLLAMLAPAYVMCRMPQVNAHGWVRLIPTTALAAWPMDVTRLVIESGPVTPQGWGQTELADRMKEEVPGDLAESILAWRLRREYRELGDLWDGTPDGDLDRVAVVDLRPIGRSYAFDTSALGSLPRGTALIIKNSFESLSVAIGRLRFEAMEGDIRYGWFSQQLIVRARPADLAWVRMLADAAAECTPKRPLVRRDDLLLWRVPTAPRGGDHVEDIARGWEGLCAEEAAMCVVEMVSRDSWRRNAGDEGSITVLWNRVAARGPQKLLDRVGEVLTLIGECERTGEEGRTGPYDAMISFGNRPAAACHERVAVWNLAKLFGGTALDVVNLSGEGAVDELIMMLKDGVDPDGWREFRTGAAVGERLLAKQVGSTLVLWATQDESIDRVGELLRQKAAIAKMKAKR